MENFLWIFMSDRICDFVLCTVFTACLFLFTAWYLLVLSARIHSMKLNYQLSRLAQRLKHELWISGNKKYTWISQCEILRRMFRYIFLLSPTEKIRDRRNSQVNKWISLFLMFSWNNAKKSLFFLLLSQYRRSFLWHYTWTIPISEIQTWSAIFEVKFQKMFPGISFCTVNLLIIALFSWAIWQFGY